MKNGRDQSQLILGKISALITHENKEAKVVKLKWLQLFHNKIKSSKRLTAENRWALKILTMKIIWTKTLKVADNILLSSSSTQCLLTHPF